MQNSEPHVIFTELAAKYGKLGLINLNRPQALNALSDQMIRAIAQQLKAWEVDPDLHAVIIQGNGGRAFCAGGDLKLLYNNGPENYQDVIPFFKDEYRLNLAIHNYSKPYIALLDGIAMGGGLGLSIHGDRVIATEKLQMAMPETAIGIYPDVGMCHVFARLAHNWGMFLGLTGNIINIAEAISIGLVHTFVPADALASIVPEIAAQDLRIEPLSVIDEILAKYQRAISSAPLDEYSNIVQECFSQGSVEEIIEALQQHQSDWAKLQAAIMQSLSPTSLKVTFKHILQAAHITVAECLEQDLNLTINMAQSHDLYEGIRAVLIDKTRDAKWQPATLAAVDDKLIDQMFVIKWQL